MSVFKMGLVVPEEFDSHPVPQVEEHVDRDGDGEQEAVEAHTGGTGAAPGKILVEHRRI